MWRKKAEKLSWSLIIILQIISCLFAVPAVCIRQDFSGIGGLRQHAPSYKTRTSGPIPDFRPFRTTSSSPGQPAKATRGCYRTRHTVPYASTNGFPDRSGANIHHAGKHAGHIFRTVRHHGPHRSYRQNRRHDRPASTTDTCPVRRQ